MYKYCAVPVVFVSAALLAAACLPQDDEWYLTAIPEETVSAYTPGSLVETEAEAAVAGQQQVGGPHWLPVGTPRVVLVEALDQSPRYEQEPVPGVDDPGAGTIKVWRVVFEGDWRLLPPPGPGDVRYDPPPYHGCGYVLLRATDGWVFQGGDAPCPP